MKKLIWFVIPLLFTTYACDKGSSVGGGTSAPMSSLADSVSYSIGVQMGENLKQTQERFGSDNIKTEFYMNGIKEALSGDSKLDVSQIQGIQMKFQNEYMEKQGGENRAKGEAFLAENASKEGVKTTATGLQYIIKEEGSGANPIAADQVEVHYEGKLLDGTVFDSSIERGTPAKFGLTQVIPGWTEGLQLMKPGAKYTFFIPSDLAYGPRGKGPQIGANETLIFEVELIAINP